MINTIFSQMRNQTDISHAILQSLNNFANQGIFTTDEKLNIYSWNHWLEIHTGKLAQEVIGKNLLDIYPELITRNLQRFYYQALAGQIVILSQRFHHYLLPMRVFNHNENEQMWQSTRIGPLLLQRECIGTLTLIDDVTDRVEREKQLQKQIIDLENAHNILQKTAEENLRLAMAINSASEGVMITDPHQINNPIIYVNPAFTKITGYFESEVIGQSYDLFLDSELDISILNKLHKSIDAQEYTTLIIQNYRKNKEKFWQELKISPILAFNGRLLYFMWLLNDVTEREENAEQIREQAALLNIATDGILVEDLTHKILFWNQGAEKIYGFKAEEILGKKTTDFLYKTINIKLIEARLTVVQMGEWYGELEQITQGGQTIIVESRWTLVKDSKNQAKSILIVNTDITRKKQLELQFLRCQRLESIGKLAGGIAHDLNNILTPILGGAQLLQIGLNPAQTQHWLRIVENNARRGADLVKQVLSFARGMEGDRIPLQVKHLIVEVGTIAKQTFPKSIEIMIDVPSNLWIVCGDVTQLNQVLMNLCINARDAIYEGGNLTIRAENVEIDAEFLQTNIEAKIGKYVLIEVSDTGHGISPENLERIFEPFFTTKDIEKGTGLGLSTVLGIVKSHQGFITVESEVNVATKFKVYLPAVESIETLQITNQILQQGREELILLVDDEKDILLIMQNLLETYGYKVICTNNSFEAMAIYHYRANQIKLVIVDLMMPYMDGITTIKELKKINSQVKIIITTGLDKQEKMPDYIALGVNKLIFKPYTAEQLLNSVYEVINTV